ncbi:hypothetical protein DB459_14420 [Bradyrhizobium sp. WD16]|nr:hypothetical protein DB459_14420 [Bradyrhizobium sp. WD16]
MASLRSVVLADDAAFAGADPDGEALDPVAEVFCSVDGSTVLSTSEPKFGAWDEDRLSTARARDGGTEAATWLSDDGALTTAIPLRVNWIFDQQGPGQP